MEKLEKIREDYSELEKKLKKTELDRTLLENQLIGLGLFPYRFQSIEKTQTNNTLNSISNLNNDTSFQRVNLEFDYAKNDNNMHIQKSVHSTNKTPEKFISKKKNFSPQTLLNNLINNQKKEKKTITDCLKLKIEIARGGQDLGSKIMNLNSTLNKQKFNNFSLNKQYNPNLSQSNAEENFQINTDHTAKKAMEKKRNNQSFLHNNKSNSHNTSVGPNQSMLDSGGIIRVRSKSSHTKNNNSLTTSNKTNTLKMNKKLENSFTVTSQEKKCNKEKNIDHKGFVLNYLKMKNQLFNANK